MLITIGTTFCAGADLEELDACEDSPTYLGDLPVPFIAAIQGPDVGLGLIVALQADLRLASPGHAADLLLTARPG